MSEIKYVTPSGLTHYDEKIKEVIDEKDKLKGDTLYYDEDTSKLQLKSGENVLSAVAIIDDTTVSGSATYSSSKIESDFVNSNDMTLALAKKVDVDEGMGLSSNDYTDDEKAKLSSLENYDDTDISDRVTAIESDYASRTYVAEEISNASKLKKTIVTILPTDTDAEEDVIYMLKDDSVTGDDKYMEYMKIDGVLTLIGSTSIDLTNYYNKPDTDALLNSKIDKVDGLGLSQENYTTEEKDKLAVLENYDDTDIKDKLTTIEDSYEKVKLSYDCTDAKYLNELIDNSTIEIDTDNNCLIVRKIDGQNVTVAEINFLTGVTSNIQEQINNLGKPMSMYGVFGTKADLLASTTPAQDGNTAIIIADEDNSNKQMTYIYIATTSTWTQVTESSITIRDFSTNPIDLSTETTGTLPKGKIDAAIARLVDVLDKSTYKGTGDGIVRQADTLTGLTATIAKLNQVITDSHIHENKAVLDKIVSNGVGSKFLVDNGQYIELLHIGTTSPTYEIQIWLDNTNSTKPILKIYDGTNWIEAVDLTDYAKKSDVPVLTDLIDDTTSSTNTVYSSNQIDEKLSDYAKTDDVETSLNNKVDKVTGKELSTNDLTNTLKTGYDDAVTKAHEHANSNILDKFSEDGSGMPLYNGDKFCLIANNLTTTEEGYALDARQGKALNTRVTALETPTFTQATSRTNIASGNTMPTILGKIMKYFTDLKSHAFNSLANNLTTTTTGYALDATQGKALNDKLENKIIGQTNARIKVGQFIGADGTIYDTYDYYIAVSDKFPKTTTEGTMVSSTVQIDIPASVLNDFGHIQEMTGVLYTRSGTNPFAGPIFCFSGQNTSAFVKFYITADGLLYIGNSNPGYNDCCARIKIRYNVPA